MVPLENVDNDHHLSSKISKTVNDLDSFTIHIFYSILNNQSNQ
jgi:hypothetical protein